MVSASLWVRSYLHGELGAPLSLFVFASMSLDACVQAVVLVLIIWQSENKASQVR